MEAKSTGLRVGFTCGICVGLKQRVQPLLANVPILRLRDTMIDQRRLMPQHIFLEHIGGVRLLLDKGADIEATRRMVDQRRFIPQLIIDIRT